jgi:hypothetical protein
MGASSLKPCSLSIWTILNVRLVSYI